MAFYLHSSLLLLLLFIPALVLVDPAFLLGSSSPSPSSSSSSFSAAISRNDSAIIGCPIQNTTNTSSSSLVYSLSRSSGDDDNSNSSTTNSSLCLLQDIDGEENDNLGWVSSLMDNMAMVGAPFASRDDLVNAGQVAVFIWNSSLIQWELLNSLISPDGLRATDYFGYSLELFRISPPSSPLRALIGCLGHDYQSMGGVGVAFMMQQSSANGSQWDNISLLAPPDPQKGLFFGSSLAVSSEFAFIGAPQIAGKAYVYGRDVNGADRWGLLKSFVAPDSHPSEF